MEVITVPVTVRNVADFEPEAAKNNWIGIQQHLLRGLSGSESAEQTEDYKCEILVF